MGRDHRQQQHNKKKNGAKKEQQQLPLPSVGGGGHVDDQTKTKPTWWRSRWIMLTIGNTILAVIMARWYNSSSMVNKSTASSNVGGDEISYPFTITMFDNGQDLVTNAAGTHITFTSHTDVTQQLFNNKTRQFKYYDDDGNFLRHVQDLARATSVSAAMGISPPRLWKSKRFNHNLHFIWPTYPRLRRLSRPKSPVPGKQIEITLISSNPRIFYISNLISEEEMEKLKELAQDPKNPYALRPSTTGTEAWDPDDKKNEKMSKTKDRTSENAFDVDSPTATTIFRRGFEVLRLNVLRRDMFDGLQIVRYYAENAYHTHLDAFQINTRVGNGYNFDTTKANGGNRFATLFLYLSDTKLGGQTLFPQTLETQIDPITREQNASLFGNGPLPTNEIERNFKSDPDSWERTLVRKCFEGGHISVKPKSGDAVLFYSLKGDGSIDMGSLHAACPVVEGSKWGANFWAWSQCRYGESVCTVPLGHEDVNEGYFEVDDG